MLWPIPICCVSHQLGLVKICLRSHGIVIAGEIRLYLSACIRKEPNNFGQLTSSIGYAPD